MRFEVDVLIKVKKIKENILNHHDFLSMCTCFSEEVCTLHISNPVFYNHIIKDSRINTLSILMNFLFSEEVSSLSDFYKICNENGYAGKNNAIALIEFLTHTNRMTLIKGADRRKRRLEMTDRGMHDLIAIMSAFVKPLRYFDPSMSEVMLKQNEFYSKYYSKSSLLVGADYEWFFSQKFTQEIYKKTAGLTFLLMIYLDLINKKVELNKPLTASYFTNFSYDLGVSVSHVTNLLSLLNSYNAICKKQKLHYIEARFIHGVEDFIASYLAHVRFLSSDYI